MCRNQPTYIGHLVRGETAELIKLLMVKVFCSGQLGTCGSITKRHGLQKETGHVLVLSVAGRSTTEDVISTRQGMTLLDGKA